MITGDTILIAHLGYPTKRFKAPMIYNPYFEEIGVNAVVMPMGVEAANYAAFVKTLFKLTNIRGALVTMPHKVSTVGLMDEVSTTARIACACNAILLRPDGSLLGDMFDGEGFVRGVARKGRRITGASALVVGSGGVGSAIAASLAAGGVARLGLFDANPASADSLAARLGAPYPALAVQTGSKDPADYDIVVNATPIGMNDGDPLPMDVARISASTVITHPQLLGADFAVYAGLKPGC
jgi:shikimate dehydrogenase